MQRDPWHQEGLKVAASERLRRSVNLGIIKTQGQARPTLQIFSDDSSLVVDDRKVQSI